MNIFPESHPAWLYWTVKSIILVLSTVFYCRNDSNSLQCLFFPYLEIYWALKLFLIITKLGSRCNYRMYCFPLVPVSERHNFMRYCIKIWKYKFIITNVLMIRSDKNSDAVCTNIPWKLLCVLQKRQGAPDHPSWWAIILCIMLAEMVYWCDIAFNNVGKFTRQWTFERWISFKRLILMM